MAAGVQVTLNFNSMDEAILALGKLAVGGAVVKSSLSTVANQGGIPAGANAAITPSTAIPSSAKPRKPRNDAGKPRGSYKEPVATTGEQPHAVTGSPGQAEVAVVETAPKAAEQVLPRETPVDLKAEPVSAAPVKSISDEQIQSAIQALWDAKGAATTLAVFSRFGVRVGRELKPEQRADFIAKALAVIEGEAV